MAANFKTVDSTELGYDPADVDRWIDLARSQFANPASHVLDASALRTAQFKLKKGGYQIDSVDAALDRLDDAFAEQEANRLMVRGGHAGARGYLDQLSELLQGRISRPKRAKFQRQPWYRKGYSVAQVDSLLAALAVDLAIDGGIEVAVLRRWTFSPRWAGYTEAQVDAFLDRAIQFLQISRSLG